MSAHENPNKPCPLCGGTLIKEPATIPFVLGRHVAVIKDVPAEVCDTCAEPFLQGEAVDAVTALLAQARAMGAEVTVLTYAAPAVAAA
jgi:YgiT-type zinc finger domain-containing protein